MDYICGEKNKELLWNILYENNIFDNIPNIKLADVKEIFENTITEMYNNNKNEKTSVLEINKAILEKINLKLINFKSNRFINLNNHDVKSEMVRKKMVNFDSNLELQKKSMDTILNPKKPTEINFSDDTDKPFDSKEMNIILEKMQKDREIMNIDNTNTNINNINTNTNNINTNKTISTSIDDYKIFDNIIINNNNNTDNRYIMTDKSDNKTKIYDIEELLENAKISENDVSVISETIENKSVKRMSKILKNPVQEFIENDYKHEKMFNENSKLDNINKQLITILENQKIILDKLDNLDGK